MRCSNTTFVTTYLLHIVHVDVTVTTYLLHIVRLDATVTTYILHIVHLDVTVTTYLLHIVHPITYNIYITYNIPESNFR